MAVRQHRWPPHGCVAFLCPRALRAAVYMRLQGGRRLMGGPMGAVRDVCGLEEGCGWRSNPK